jgi:hypothetical protein
MILNKARFKVRTDLLPRVVRTMVLSGHVYDNTHFMSGTSVFVSRPIRLNRKTRVITTLSGNEYELLDTPDSVLDEIDDVIAKGTYEVLQ